MPRKSPPADVVLKKILSEVDPGLASAAGEHPDAETLALFATASIDALERDAVVHHVSACAECRQTVATLLALDRSRHSALDRGRRWLAAARPDAALEQFQIATDLDRDDGRGWFGQGQACMALEDWVGAEMALRRASQLDPDDAAARVRLADALEAQSRTAEAQEIWKVLLAGPAQHPHDERVPHEHAPKKEERHRDAP